jgi:hypothetical protein
MRVPFGDFVLDTGARELLRGGEPVHLSPKAYLLLETLVQNLANLVAELRAALGEDRKHATFVRTVHGFGYAFRAASDAPTLPPAAPERCRLVWNGGAAALAPGDHYLGRDPELPFPFSAPGVSRRHAVIRVAGQGATIEDLDSKNGTYVNDRKIGSATPLADGDKIMVGSFSVTFRSRPPADSTETLG